MPIGPPHSLLGLQSLGIAVIVVALARNATLIAPEGWVPVARVVNLRVAERAPADTVLTLGRNAALLAPEIRIPVDWIVALWATAGGRADNVFLTLRDDATLTDRLAVSVVLLALLVDAGSIAIQVGVDVDEILLALLIAVAVDASAHVDGVTVQTVVSVVLLTRDDAAVPTAVSWENDGEEEGDARYLPVRHWRRPDGRAHETHGRHGEGDDLGEMHDLQVPLFLLTWLCGVHFVW